MYHDDTVLPPLPLFLRGGIGLPQNGLQGEERNSEKGEGYKMGEMGNF